MDFLYWIERSIEEALFEVRVDCYIAIAAIGRIIK
jgi:hypothetical protein